MTTEHTFVSNHLDTALARVRRELGRDAIIVSSRRLAADAFEVRAIAKEAAPDPRGGGAGSLLLRLLEGSGIEPSLALQLAGEASPRTLNECVGHVASELERRLRFEAPSFAPRGEEPRTIALVGGPGVGKTTTLAKLAAQAALVERRATAIVTLDAYRVGAVAQVEQLADLIGIPLEVAHDASSFRRAMRRLADAETVFVDTAGRSRRDRAAIDGLAETLQSTESEVDVTLLISATARRAEIEETVARHRALEPAWLTVTKLDDALTHDAVVTAALASGLPLAWLTTGQRVPEDVEAASASRLSAALCGEEVYG